MGEQYRCAYVIDVEPTELVVQLERAMLPSTVHVSRVQSGSHLLFEGKHANQTAFLCTLPWLIWIESVDSVSSWQSLELVQNGELLYEESLDPDGWVHVLYAGERRSCDAARIDIGNRGDRAGRGSGPDSSRAS
jgi:hypothetical protein